ncbi:ATP-dependent Clp protease ATP-binding subunit, partial [Patescibacteria group bacterium]|nr:ATP-dependent Clp protease ATP-binding subunit [Patescibacteria group bacterium]
QLEFIKEEKREIFGVWFLGRFLFWNYEIKKSISALKKAKSLAYNLGNILLRMGIIAGWLAFFVWLYLNQTELSAEPLEILFFWREFHPLILVFLLSLWLDLFLIYRKSEKKDASKKINFKLFDSEKNKNKTEGKSYNVSRAYPEKILNLLDEAYFLAKKLNQDRASIIHIFRILLKEEGVQNVFVRLNVDAKRLISFLDRNMEEGDEAPGKFSDKKLSLKAHQSLILAFVEAFAAQRDSVDALDLLQHCCNKSDLLTEILTEMEISPNKIRNTIAWFRINQKLIEKNQRFGKSALLKPGTNMNRSYTAIATPTLDQFSHDLTIQAKFGQLEMCIGRDKEFKEIFQSFVGGYNGILLVGPSGVGKTAIINGLAQMMVEERVPKFLKDRRLIELDVPTLVAGADASVAQERLLLSISEANHSGNIVLYIDNLENLIGITSGSQESLDLSEVLAEAIRRKHIFCIASANTRNYSSYIEGRAIGEAMKTVNIEEPDSDESVQILESKVGSLESKYGIFVVYSALQAAVDMSKRFLHDQFLPLKAINLLERATAFSAQRAINNPDDLFCDKENVASAISEMTGVPATKITESESQKLLNLEEEIHQRLVGQEIAVQAVAASLRRARVELKDSRRPIANFLFLGPTGVGKTELAKAVSESYFGDEDYVIRLDMSEYQGADAINKMIGSIDGTLGYLTEAVRKKPFSLILLDEIEKSNPDVLNLFLQLFDEGRLTDAQGRSISFSESIIIATSNIGAVFIQEEIKKGTGIEIIKQGLIDEHLNKYLRPELINRFDGVIVFKPLTKENIFAITTLMLKKIKKSLAKKGIGLRADKNGVIILARDGYDPKFGARPLRRLLQERVENVIANKILSGELKRRDVVLINSKAEIEVEAGAKL